MGPTILTVPRVLRPHLRRGRARHGEYLDLRPARPAMALLLRRRHACSICARTWTPWRAAWTPSRPAPASRLPRLHRHVAERCTRSRRNSSSGNRSRASATRIDLKANFDPGTLRDVLACAWARIGGRADPRATCRTPGVAQMLDHFVPVCRLARPTPSPAVLCSSRTCRPSGASGTRWAARARWRKRWRSSPRELGVDLRPDTEVTRLRSSRAAR